MNLEAESSAQLMRVQSGTVLTQREQIDTFSRLRDGLRSVVHSYGWRTEYPESAGSSQASSSFPCSTTESAPPIPPYNTGNCSTLHNGYTHDNRCSGITYNGFATGFGPTPPYAAPGTWVPPPASYFSAHGPPPFVPMGPPPPMTFAAMGPPPQKGSYTPTEAGPSHVATPGTTSAIALTRSNIDSIPLFNID